MSFDKKILYTVSTLYLGVLLLICLISYTAVGKMLLAIYSVTSATAVYVLIKKRSVHAIERKQATLLMFMIAMAAIMLYLLSGLRFGFYRVIMPAAVFGNYILPFTLIVISSEIMRSVMMAQKNRIIYILSYCSFVILDAAMLSGKDAFENFSGFMSLIGMSLFPAITANLLYHYLSSQYGALPCIVYKLPIALYPYLLPIRPQISNALLAFIKIFLPLVLYLFIHTLYAGRKFVVSRHKIRIQFISTTLLLVLMTLGIMLVSCQFRFCLLVIGSDSMSGEIEKGDAIIYERYDRQIVQEGQVIVFQTRNTNIIHRVVDIQRINGETRYYTKGDANDSIDIGYITADQIVGITTLKIKYLGFPTIWARELFQ